MNKPVRVFSPFTQFHFLSSLFLIASFLSIYDGLGQSSVKISLPLNRTVFQQSAANSSTFQLAGQVKNYFRYSNAIPEYQIESLDIAGNPISIPQTWTNAGINYSATTGFFNKTINLTTGWYRISVRYSGGNPDAIKVGVGEVIFTAGQSNSQGVELGGSKGTIPNLGSNYDCINTVNENGFCKNTYKFPEFSKMEFSGTNTFSKVAPNGNETLWCYQALGKNIVDRKSTSLITTPVMFFNAGSGGTGMDNWKASAEFPNNTTPNPLTGSILNCAYNDPDPAKAPQWNRDGPGDGPVGHPYLGLRTSLNYYGGMLGTRGILWHQGETETALKLTGSTDAGNYQGKLEYVIQKTKDHFSNNISWAISRVSSINLFVDKDVRDTQAAVKNSANNSRVTWGAYYSDQIEFSDNIANSNRLADKTHFNASGLLKLAELYDTGTFAGNPGDPDYGNSVQGGTILSLIPVEFNNRPSLALNVTRPTTTEITMSVSGVYSAYRWVKNEGKISDSPTDKWTQSITVDNSGTDRWRCYVKDSKGNVAITQEVALPVREALVTGIECPSGTFNPTSDKITCGEISGWMFRGNSNGEFGKVDIYVDGQFKNAVSANSTKPYGTAANNEGYIYNVPLNASWRDGVNHVISVRQCNYSTNFDSRTLNCPAYTDISITDKTGLNDVSSSGGTGTFIVNSTNANWTISTGGASWATVSPTSGFNGGTAVSVTFQANSGSTRNATLTINDSNAGVTRFVDISQQGTGGGLPACNCGFTLLSANQNAGQYVGTYTFNSCNASSHKWKLLDGVTEIANSGSNAYTVTSSTVNFNVPTSVNTGNYQLRVDADNCTGSGTLPFNYTKPNGGNSLSLSQNTWSPSSSSNSLNVSVNSNISWSASSSDGSWLTVSPSSGSNNGTINLSVTANSSTASRIGTITVAGSGVGSQTISISQSGTGGGGSTCSNISTVNCGNASEGYTHTINISTAGDYKFKIMYATGESNATGNITIDSDPPIQFSVGPSTGSWSPSVEVFVGNIQKTLSAGNHSIRISGINNVSGSNFAHNKLCAVLASGGNSLSLSQNTWLPGATANSQNVSVSSNINWTASTDSPSWLTVSPSSGSNNGTITLSATANSSTASRTGIVTVAGSGVSSQTVSVSQSGTGGGGSTCSNISTTNCGNASEGYTHTVNITNTGCYKFQITYASGESNATGNIIIDSDPPIQFYVGPSTGSWNPSVDVFVGNVLKTLSAGNHSIRISGVNSVSGSNFAHNKLCAVPASGCRIAASEEQEEVTSIYPNPTTGKIKIVFALQKAENVWLNLYDVQGKSLDLRDFEGKSGRNEMEYDLQNYPSGAYFVNFQSSEKREVLKVMKVN